MAEARGDRRGRPQRRPRSATAPSRRSRGADPARTAAFQVLREVDDGAYANLVLPTALRRARLSGRDAAFATELCYGTLRMQGLYDPILASVSGRQMSGLDPAVLTVLRMGAHQLLGMRVPAHAAVDGAVALTRGEVGIGPSGLVNAVLRKLADAGEQVVEEVVAARQGELEQLAVRHSHPGWIVRALRAALLGHRESTQETVGGDLADLLAAQNHPGPLGLVERPGLGAEADLRAAGAVRHPVVPTAWTLERGDPGAIGAVRDGRAAVQDPGSQVVALALAAAEVTGADAQWLDLCAGPGGKAALLAAIGAQRDAALVAVEVSEHRSELVRQTLGAARRAGAEVEVITGDGREAGQWWPQRFDRVLVDAPCTGLGALRRRPEARWRRSADDLPGLGALQRALLASAIAATRPGGVIMYSTCSPHLAETSLLISDILKANPDVVAEDVRPLAPTGSPGAWSDLGPGPAVQLWPHRHDTDGMFFALLRKVAA